MLATPHSLSLGTVAHSPLQEAVAARSAGTVPRKVALHDFLVTMIAVDILGAAALAIATLQVRALPAAHAAAMVWGCIAGFAVVWGLSAYLQELYSRKALSGGLRRLLSRTAVTWAQTFGLMLLVGFGLGLSSDVSRLWFLVWAGSVLVWIAAGRLVWRAALSRLLDRGYCLERVLVLAGTAEAAVRARHRVERESHFHIRAISAGALPGLPGAATLEWVEEAVREGLVDRVIVARFAGAMEQTNALLRRLARVAVDVTLLPDLEGLQAPVLKVDRIGMLPAIDLDFHPLSPLQAAMKRAEDLTIATLALLAVLPLLGVVAVAIRLDSPGPVLFRQVRIGFNGRPFRVWKFRTMHAHARDDDAVRQTTRHDRRITRIGRFLRRSSIDELPQLFNVLAGDMSIVGPRPHARGMTALGLPLHDVVAEYSARHRLKPGITGWAQVNGCRGEVDSHEKLRRRVAFDFHYIENWSLTFDLWIIVRTVVLMAFDKNAY